MTWTGNLGSGTSGVRAYRPDHSAGSAVLPLIAASSDPAYGGDPDRWNPELELTAALAQCHMLSYLYLCAVAGVIVTAYADDAQGIMETIGGTGRFTEVVLRPRVTVTSADMMEAAARLHEEAQAKCFIANSVNFPVRHEPVVRAQDEHAT